MELASLNFAQQRPQHCFDTRFNSHTSIAGVTPTKVVATISTSETIVFTGRNMDILVEFKDACIILPGITFVKRGFLSFWQLDTLTGYVIRSLDNARSLAVCRKSCATWAASGSPPQSRQSRRRKEHSNEIQSSTWVHLVISILNGQTKQGTRQVQFRQREQVVRGPRNITMTRLARPASTSSVRDKSTGRPTLRCARRTDRTRAQG